MKNLVQKILAGDIRSIARAITLAENEDYQAVELLRSLYPHTGQAYLVGITGPPGGGKSTLVDRMIAYYRKLGLKVAVIGIDPSSTFTGGALLGDRVRMQAHATDNGVFIRSMGSRGHLGGLAVATADSAKILDAAGYDIIIFETVGIGQSEIEVASQVDTTVLVTVPGLGDDIQVLKAGTMEIADIFVVNKADRDGVEKSVMAIEQLLSTWDMTEDDFVPPILKVTAKDNIGIGELAQAIEQHKKHLNDSGKFETRRRNRAVTEVHTLILNQLDKWARDKMTKDITTRDNIEEVYLKFIDPHTVAREALRELEMETMWDKWGQGADGGG
ncbi:MAG: methylmalonyl Co-A mutase-associated GTPase MeaB [Candidatus Edwardsbacteria bacterium]|nr:methylmalonyl Co-A mutase-associated GTPase MeaB [Candidatus Edwardsbacteria bacterium]MBU1577219.1 methylmalonyl Co-A mutase-associated GTPase MeaB [Candidatus Edwardsbacteria bacterium]MBU2462567.1 methylmalonyl Co-A mutase-associated GTPase MeaB [Candidatus Edwardsbacteria bacterium]MBU2594120.1 methylmalonyl Co-A mutase-associated GTPase MeaB [Candidatus Edwardsbacteria bacterium]